MIDVAVHHWTDEFHNLSVDVDLKGCLKQRSVLGHADKALVIGVNEYPKLAPGSNLEGCVNDVFAMSAVLQERPLTVGRELTKQFEEIATMPAQDFAAWLAAGPQRTRGEFALVLHAWSPNAGLDDSTRVLQLLLAELPLKTAVKVAAEITGAPRNELYETALKLKKE